MFRGREYFYKFSPKEQGFLLLYYSIIFRKWGKSDIYAPYFPAEVSYADLVSQIVLNSGYIWFSLWISPRLLRLQPSLAMFNLNIFLSFSPAQRLLQTSQHAILGLSHPELVFLSHIFSCSPLPLIPLQVITILPFSFIPLLISYLTPLLQKKTTLLSGWPTVLKSG